MNDKKKEQAANAVDPLKVYRDLVRFAIEENLSQVVPNEEPAHARIILEEMAKHSTKTFCAVSNKLSEDVWDSAVIAAISLAIERGVKVRLLVERPCENAGRLPENVRKCVRSLSPRFGELPNLAIMDGRVFRVETDKSARKALFGVNVKALSEQIANASDKIELAFDVTEKEA